MKNSVQTGDVITLADSVLVKPSTRVAGGDPVVVGKLSGVAFNTTTASTDLVDIQRVGVFNLSVTGVNAGGNVAVAVGDKIYIDPAASAALNAKVANVPFGIALGAITSGATATIPVLLTGF